MLAFAFLGNVHAQEVHTKPGQFDFYLLNMSWAPEFCHNVEVLPESHHEARRERRAQDATTECGTPHGFVLHGLWPQNFDGTYPINCSDRPGQTDYRQYLDMTPSLTLLEHEWNKHGTCTTLATDDFFHTARRAFHSVQVPQQLQNVAEPLTLRPDDILGQFYRANPGFPQGSFVLSCGRNYLTAIEACFDKASLKPIACQGLRGCRANVVKVAPETSTAAPAR